MIDLATLGGVVLILILMVRSDVNVRAELKKIKDEIL